MGDERRRPAPVRLARLIAHDLIEGGVPVGAHLGALPEVAERYAVSVPTLRKAIAYLLDDGFVVSREGRGGGLFVGAPPGRTALRAMHLFFAGRDLGREGIDEARSLVDAALAERACRLVDEADAARLAAALDMAAIREDSGPTPDIRAALRSFDQAVLAAARQPVLALISGVLEQLAGELEADHAPDLEPELELRRHTARAILAGDLAEAIALRRAARTLMAVQDDTGSAMLRPGRLAEQTAEAIGAMVRRRRLAPGDEIGLEPGLQDQFGVGRGTLRDALRTLERAGTVKISQGRGGGVFVGAAEPYAAAEMAALYLSSIRLTFQEQVESRQVLEARAAWLAAKRITPELRVRLQRAMEMDAQGARDGVADWPARGAQVERLIASACANPLLEFFTLALVDLSMIQARRQGFAIALDLRELARRVSLHHAGIVEAILQAAPALAAFRTRQYLKTLGSWIG